MQSTLMDPWFKTSSAKQRSIKVDGAILQVLRPHGCRLVSRLGDFSQVARQTR